MSHEQSNAGGAPAQAETESNQAEGEEMSTLFRIRFKVAGGHVHCRFFSGKRENETFAKLGDFTVTRGQEFQDLLHEFRNASFIGDDTDGIAEAISEAWER